MNNLSAKDIHETLGWDELKDLATLGALSEEAIDFLLQEGELLHLDKDDVVFCFGDAGDSFHVILKGAVSFYKPGKEEKVHIRDYEQGQEIGFVAMVALHQRVGDCIAREDSIILKVNSFAFHKLHEELPKAFGVLLLNLSREVARRLKESDDKLAEHDIHI